MKKIFGFIFTFFAFPLFACDILLTPNQESYKIGDIAIIKIELILNHRSCDKEQEEPKITVNGLEITAKTKFKKKADDTWGISYKVKITEKENLFTAYRECVKGGGNASLSLKAE